MSASMTSSRVAVLIVNWNGGPLLDRCLDCVSKQAYSPHRVIVVDNGSIDRSADTIASSHPGVQVVKLGRNEGFARANNIGASVATDCEWIALLNTDAFPEPEWLEALMREARKHRDCASFGSHMRMAGALDRLDGIGDVYHVSGAAWRNRRSSPAASSAASSSEIFSACAAAALYRRDAF